MARKKRKADEPPPSAGSTSAPAADSIVSTWQDPPQDILLSIRDRFSLSIPDLLAFSSVCRSWRSAAKSVAAPFTGPPLLLVPSGTPSGRGSLRWPGPPQCRLKALTVTTRSYRPAISSKTLRKKCVGCSNGQLIFVGRKRGVIADVFTGREVHPPEFPAGDRRCRFAFGILTAPLSSHACLLLLVSFDSACGKFTNILCWKPGTADWSKLELKNWIRGIMTIGVFKDRILLMNSCSFLFEVGFYPHPSCKSTKDGQRGLPIRAYASLDRYLVECGEELLFVWIDHNGNIEVYRLDLSGCRGWVKMECLGDWCLFIDDGCKFAVACHDPRRWGGRDNCIYFASWRSDTWVEVPLGGRVPAGCGPPPLRTWGHWAFELHAPVWVYPSMLL